MPTVPLQLTGRHGGVVWLDPQDHQRALPHRWRISHAGYVVSTFPDGRLVYLARWIVGEPPGLIVSPHNGDRLYLSRDNLIATPHPRQVPRSLRGSNYHGVLARTKGPRKFWALLTLSRKGQVYGGDYDTELEAARAYDALARRYGTTRLNFP